MSADLIRKSTVVIGFGVIGCFYYYWGWSTEMSSFGGDSAGYMLAAQYYSPYQQPSPIAEEYSQLIIYPPLFPWLLAVASGGTNVLAAHLMITTFLLAALLSLYHWLRTESFSPTLASAIALLFAAMPSTRYITMSIWTENVYLFFSLFSVWAVSRANYKSQKAFWYIAAIAIACATLVRVAAMPLLLAFGIYLLIKQPRNWPFLLCIASIPIAVWLLLGHQEQTGISGYTTVWKARYSDDSIHFLFTKFIEQLQLIERSWVGSWQGSTGSTTLAIVSRIFGVLSIVGFLTRLKNKNFDAIFVGIYLIVLLAWHSSGEVNRYAYVIYPFSIVYGYLGASCIFNFFSDSDRTHRIVSLTVTSLLLLTLIPAFMVDFRLRLMKLPPEVEVARQTDFWYLLEDRALAFYNIYNQAKLIEHFKEINRLVPESDCIYTIKPTVIAFYTNRSTASPPPEELPDNEFWATINRCNYVYGIIFTSLAYSQPYYPITKLGRNIEVISTTENPLSDHTVPVAILAKITKPIAR